MDREFSDIAFAIFIFSIAAVVIILEIHNFVVWAIPRGLFTSVLYLFGCLAGDSFVAAILTME